MSEEPLNESLAAVQSALAGLALKPSGLDRDRVMYLAGQAAASRSRSRWRWTLATAASWLLTFTVAGLWLLGQPEQQATTPAIASNLPVVTVSPSAAPLRSDYLALRQLLLTQGVEALPSPQVIPASPEKPLRPRDAYGGWSDGSRS